MGKKYLLYIHHPSFEAEQGKSALINELLDRHYNSDAIPMPARTATAVAEKPKPKKIINTPADVPKAIPPKPSSEFKTCPNGHPTDSRGKCFGKKCKYSK